MQLARFFLRTRGASALTDPDVAKALRLSETQVIRIKDVQRKSSASLRERIRQRLHGPRRERGSLLNSLRELRAETDQRAFSMLNSEQQEKVARYRGQDAAP
jgi:hypothetical protein